MNLTYYLYKGIPCGPKNKSICSNEIREKRKELRERRNTDN